MIPLEPLAPATVPDLLEFLTAADLTLSGLEDPGVRLWLLRSDDGSVLGCTGYELSPDRLHVLVRSVAVDPTHRGRGVGAELARQALARASAEGAGTAWLFSRRSGPFWRGLGFTPADRQELVDVLGSTHQVRLFRRTGQLDREVAWVRTLPCT